MRSVLVALLLFGFVAQHFMCCCGSPCAVVCDEHWAAETYADEHDCACHHGHGATCAGETDEQPRPDSDSCPVGHGSDHDHHLCLGTHVFFNTSNERSIDFSLQLTGFLLPPDTADLFVRQAVAVRSAPDAGPPDKSSPQKLRAQLCVYRV